MRLLPGRHDHGHRRPAAEEPESQRRRHRRRADQYLPLRHLQPHPHRDPRRRGQRGRRQQRPAHVRGGRAMTALNIASAAVSRRGFIVGSAAALGGFSLGFHIPFGEALAQGAAPEINAWVVVRPDDTVVIRIARSEMGQGTLTGLAQLVAEELQCDWSKVTTEYPTPGQNPARNRAWGNFSTGGSRGIRESHDYVRRGGAAARMMLVQAAAGQWGVPAGECTAANSVITHTPSGRSVTYGQVADAAAKVAPPTDVPLKDPKDWTIAGKPLKRLDTADKLTGKQVYGIDLQLPGMLNAAIRDCPVFGGRVKSFDAASVSAMP